jgi:hypothetical protein
LRRGCGLISRIFKEKGKKQGAAGITAAAPSSSGSINGESILTIAS